MLTLKTCRYLSVMIVKLAEFAYMIKGAVSIHLRNANL